MERRGRLTNVTRRSRDFDPALAASIVDGHFDRSLAAGSAPAMVYAVLDGDTVVYSRGIGSINLPSGPAPDADTVFRIASMTKSFTAALLLTLRDDQLLHLDATVVDLVPELAAGGRDAREITIRQLMTMGGGFLTDDPWGDRQQDLPIPDFRRLVAKGLVPLWPPGVRFEYSNLGYALLGLVVESVTGQAYREAVAERLLRPLGMASSGYEVDDLGDKVVATGYARRSSGWVAEPIASAGAFSPMGGLLSTVNDLAAWVGNFQSVHAGDDPPAAPIRAASLREMQVTQRLISATRPVPADAAPDVTGYGFGLFEDFRDWGRSVYHSGGYPGFGSHMRWHPASGLGIVALANGTYASMGAVATAALGDLVKQLGVPRRTPPIDLAMLEVAREAVRDWLVGPDPEGSAAEAMRRLCADNVETDVPWPERVVSWQGVRRAHGALEMVPDSVSRPSPGAIRWLMRGSGSGATAGNLVRVTVLVAPHDPQLIQYIEVKPLDSTAPAETPATDWS